MIDTKHKEELSMSYLNAVCAVRGIAMERNGHDEDGVDLILQKIFHKKKYMYNARMAVQLKSTSSELSESETSFSYPLKKKNYDDLRLRATVKPFLFLFVLPKEEKDWVHHTLEELIIRKCMYWANLAGFPDKENQSTVSVPLSKKNVVSPDTLEQLLSLIAEEEL